MKNVNTEFNPDYDQLHPGVFLEEFLGAQGIKKTDFARRCGRPTKTISEIISGISAITPETALQFERVLGAGSASAKMWLRLQQNWQLQTVRQKDRAANAEVSAWVKNFPTNDMKRLGFITSEPGSETWVNYFLRYFQVSSIRAWEEFWDHRLNLARFKQQRPDTTHRYAVAAWLNQAERQALAVDAESYNETLFRSALAEIRKMTRQSWEDVGERLVELCRLCGVALVFLPYLKNTGLRGAAFWATKDKAVIALSDYGKSEERVWFAFFHEAAHILFHSKKAMFVDLERVGSQEKEIEQEANEYAANFLIPKNEVKRLINTLGPKANPSLIKQEASRLEISPGLLVERLKHEYRYGRSAYKNLRRELVFPNCDPFE